MTETSPYEFRLLDLSDEGLKDITDLLNSVFPDSQHINEALIDWEYRKNPDGMAVGFNAWHGSVLVGHYVTIPLRAIVNSREEKGLLSLNTATHTEHRGKGLFTQLANKTYKHAASEGYSFVIGVANANSTHGFTKKLGFQLVAPLKAMFGIGRLQYNGSTGNAHYERIWSRDALEWRLSHPVYNYELDHGSFTTIYSTQGKFGARYVVGVLPEESSIGKDLPMASALPMKLWIGLDERFDWKGKLYRNIPMRFRPSPLNLIFKDLTNTDRTLEADKVRFQALDFDTL